MKASLLYGISGHIAYNFLGISKFNYLFYRGDSFWLNQKTNFTLDDYIRY